MIVSAEPVARAGEQPNPDFPTAVFPDRATFGGRTVRIGRTGYALLALVLRTPTGVPLVDVGPAVYGQSVKRNRIEVAVCRINRRLVAVGCLARLGVDGGFLVVY